MESNQGSTTSYYGILGVDVDSTNEQIKRAYRKLAMQWHPDKWVKNPSVLGKAQSKFQQIQEAYEVLSDQRKRSMYDVGFYNHQDEEDEGFADFMQEMSSLMKNVKKEEKKYSLGEIQSKFWEMAQSFNQSTSSCFDDDGIWSQDMFVVNEDSRSLKRARANTNPLSGFGVQEAKCV